MRDINMRGRQIRQCGRLTNGFHKPNFQSPVDGIMRLYLRRKPRAVAEAVLPMWTSERTVMDPKTRNWKHSRQQNGSKPGKNSNGNDRPQTRSTRSARITADVSARYVLFFTFICG